MSITPWKTLASRYVINDPWLKLRADRCVSPRGVLIDPYYVQEPADWVQVVAFDDHDRILISRQYRHGIGLVCAELPCGTVEAGEPPVEAMRRELLEETGCEVASLSLLTVLSPNPARYANRVHCFVATGAKCVQQPQPDPTEDIEFAFLSIGEWLGLLESGNFPQALHVAAVFLALRSRHLLSIDI